MGAPALRPQASATPTRSLRAPLRFARARPCSRRGSRRPEPGADAGARKLTVVVDRLAARRRPTDPWRAATVKRDKCYAVYAMPNDPDPDEPPAEPQDEWPRPARRQMPRWEVWMWSALLVSALITVFGGWPAVANGVTFLFFGLIYSVMIFTGHQE